MQHLSMRVPWRDRPWDEHVCDHPLDNASCLLLKNIGDKREDDYETAHAGQPFEELDAQRLPCLSERGSFMSPFGYSVTKTHPYSYAEVLKDHLRPSVVNMPGYSFEAVPFRWLAKTTFEEEIWPSWQPTYDPSAEDRALSLLKRSRTNWIMDGHNQASVIRAFFEPVTLDDSLVFIYVKHSPFQEETNARLLVGAARITSLRLPGLWTQVGLPPFPSSMWETAVVHSLRPDMRDGVLLPYASLIEIMDDGTDISAALAFAPPDRVAEFSFVTEHVSDDGAIAALESLRDAAAGCRELGLELPQAGVDWIEEQLERLWQDRGPTPGLGAVLKYLQVPAAYPRATEVQRALAPGADIWDTLTSYLTEGAPWPEDGRPAVPPSVGLAWQSLSDAKKDALRLLSAMDVTATQVALLMDGQTPVELTDAELVDNPYFASICTWQHPQRISFDTVDRALFPARHVSWATPVPESSRFTDPGDRRRVEALIVDVLEEMAGEGDTLASENEVIARANSREQAQPCQLTSQLLRAYQLSADTASGSEDWDWAPVIAVELADGSSALKLTRLEDTKATILDSLDSRVGARRFVAGFDCRNEIDHVLPDVGEVDAEEETARSEKAAGLQELYESRLSVLVGPAGTGKTTLLKALADRPDVAAKGLLLLAPTGKAAVQLQKKVGNPTQTLARFLVSKGGYDFNSGRYAPVDPAHRKPYGTVIIDEASMLTEEMLAATLSALGKVDRLILVGDPRQLPPIGAGRPFVDLVESLRPDTATAPMVGPGYVELTVFRRQNGSEREDLALAAWFGGGESPAGADEIWERLRRGDTMATLSAVPWKDGDIVATIMDTLGSELDFSGSTDREYSFQMTYGGKLDATGKYLNWHTGPEEAGANCERWQILTPTRSRAFGTVEINRHIKRTLRTADLEKARRNWSWRNPKPLGPELIVRGDKVMQTRNAKMDAYPKGSGLDYVANGDIGVLVGEWSRAKRPLWARVEFASQPGSTYSYRPSSSDDAPLELAWAVTVHKSQGSEFGTTFVILPKKARLSRELLYTALTRQTDRVVLLHEGSIDDLIEMADPSRSETARRMTDLFRRPRPRLVRVHDEERRFDDNLIHVAATGILVRSKNEVIIADILEAIAPGRWTYESRLTGADGSFRLPDFTVETASGDTVIWEHLGMMSNPRYARDWATKKDWYASNGVLPFDDADGPGPNGTLMWTDDAGGVDRPGWQSLAEKVIGTARPRRAAKKSVSKGAPRDA